MAQRGGALESRVAVRTRAEGPLRARTSGLRLPALRSHHALQREAETDEDRLTRLLRRLLRLERERERPIEFAGDELDLAEETRGPGPTVLVPDLARVPEQGFECVTRLGMAIHPYPPFRDGDEGLIEHARFEGCFLQLEAARLCRFGARVPEQRLRRETRHEDVAHERVASGSWDESEGALAVSKPFLESLERPDAARRDALVRYRGGRTVVARFLDDLQEQLACLLGLLVEADARQDRQGTCPLRTGGQRGNDGSKLGFSATRVSGLEVEECGVHGASYSLRR